MANMIKLHNLVPSKPGTKFLFDGEVYQIDDEGNVEVPEEAAKALLRMSAWELHGATPGWTKAERKPQGGMGLVTSGGEVITKEEAQSTQTEETPEVADPPIPAEGEEWSDPKPEYSREWLEKCADAYDVGYRKNTKTETLVANITKAMYSDD